MSDNAEPATDDRKLNVTNLNDEKKPFEVPNLSCVVKYRGLSSLDFHSENL